MTLALQGRRILVTRPAAQAGPLAAMIAERGGEALLFPLIDIAAAPDPQPLQHALAHLDDYALAIFISPNAVAFSLPAVCAERPWPAHLKAAAVGPGTAKLLAAEGIAPVIVPDEQFDSEGLLDRPELQADRLAGQKVLILRGNGGREELADTLRRRGAQVDAVTVYHRSPPADGAGFAALWRQSAPDALTISSSEGLRNLAALIEPELRDRVLDTPLFAPHRRIAEVAAELGWREIILTRPADAGIIEALCAYAWPGRERQ